MTKTATVYTNDKKHPVLSLTISGMVERFAMIRPERVILRGAAGRPIRRSVKIITEEKYPFRIVSAKAKDGTNIRFELAEMEDSDRSGYILNIENLKSGKGRYYDTIALTTDSKVKPVIRIGVYGLIKERLGHPTSKKN